MKKFILGFLIGTLIVSSVSVYGSNTLSVFNSATRVVFNFQNACVEMDTTENEIFYINGRAYIPLRHFAENVGSTVNYTEQAGVRQIDIIAKP